MLSMNCDSGNVSRPIIDSCLNGDVRVVDKVLRALSCDKGYEDVVEEGCDVSMQDFKDALVFAMYAVSKFSSRKMGAYSA